MSCIFRLSIIPLFISFLLLCIGCNSSEDGLIKLSHERLKNGSYEGFYRWSIVRRDSRIEDPSYATFYYYTNDSDFVRFAAIMEERVIRLLIRNEDSVIEQLGFESRTQLTSSLEKLALSFFELKVLEVTALPRFNGCTVFGLEDVNKLLYYDPNQQCAMMSQGENITWLDDHWFYQ